MPKRDSIKYLVSSINKGFIHNTKCLPRRQAGIIHDTKQTKSPGFTLIELLIGLVLVGVIATIIFSIYFANFKFFTTQSVAIAAADQNKIAIDEIGNTARQAVEAPVSCTGTQCQSGCTASCTSTYITNDGWHLILKLWPLDLNGNPLDPSSNPVCTFDYISYYLGNNPTAPTPTQDADGTYHLTRETAGSSNLFCPGTHSPRGKKIIATKLPSNGLNFQLIPLAPNSTEIKMTVKTQGNAFFLPVPYTITKITSARFKNRASSSSVQISFQYTVQAGTGGINFKGPAPFIPDTITGKAYSNGSITCPSGQNNYCKINGDAWMVSSGVMPVTPTTGYLRQSGATSQPFPTIIEADWQNAASCNNDANCIQDCPITPPSTTPTCTIGGSPFLKPGAPTGTSYKCCQFNGNLMISSGSVTVLGPIYAKSVSGANPAEGSITVSSSAIIPDATTLGSCGTVILADGRITISAGSFVDTTGASPPGYLLFETNTTLDPAISFISGNGVTNNAIYYAKSGRLSITNSTAFLLNNGAYVGNTVDFSQNNLSYGSGLPDAKFCY